MRNLLSNCVVLTFVGIAAFTNAFNQPIASLPSISHTPVEVPGNEKIVLITKGGWVMHRIVSDKPCDTNGDGILTKNIASELPACAMDDIMYIKPNGKVVFERNKRCDPSEGTIETYNWELTSNNKFVITKGSVVADMLFKYVTKEELALVIPSEAHGVMYYFTVTYRHP